MFGTPIFFTCLDASWEQRLHPEHPGPDSHEKPGPSGASLAQISEHLGATSWEGWAPLVLTSLSSSTDFVNFRLLQCKFLKRLGPCPRVSSSCCLRLQRLLADASQTLCDFSFVACFFAVASASVPSLSFTCSASLEAQRLQCKFLRRQVPSPRVSPSCHLRLQRLLADASQTLCDFSFVACFFGLRPLQVYLVCRSLVLSRWRQSCYSVSS